MRKRTSDSGTLLQNFRCYSHSSHFCSVSAVGKYCGNRKKWIWHIISLLSPSTFLSNQIQNCCVLNKKLIVVWQTYTFTFIPLSICFFLKKTKVFLCRGAAAASRLHWQSCCALALGILLKHCWCSCLTTNTSWIIPQKVAVQCGALLRPGGTSSASL